MPARETDFDTRRISHSSPNQRSENMKVLAEGARLPLGTTKRRRPLRPEAAGTQVADRRFTLVAPLGGVPGIGSARGFWSCGRRHASKVNWRSTRDLPGDCFLARFEVLRGLAAIALE